jgi:phage terminase large subunit-like protein
VCHVYEAPKDADISKRESWLAANPALGTFRSEKDMARQAEKAGRMPSFENTFRNLNLNQRVSTVSPFISRSVWELCGVPINTPRKWYAGLDLSARNDLTALVIAGEADDGVWDVFPFFWTPQKTLEERTKTDRAPYDVWVREGCCAPRQALRWITHSSLRISLKLSVISTLPRWLLTAGALTSSGRMPMPLG